ncbi:MAG: hypothetical protein ACOC8N_00945 [Spirochaetota bacterium]
MIGHDVLTYLCARAAGFPAVPVTRTPYTYGGDDPGPYNPDYRWELREGTGPAVSAEEPYFDENEFYAPFVPYHAPSGGKVSALEVLALYSAEPDWGMDAGMRLSPLQALTGGSQGYRHLRYGLFGLRVGTAHRRAPHFTRMARLAASRRDPYWCARFAARALHYLEDLASPFHTKPFPERAVPAGLLHPRRLYFAVYNYHLNLERAVGYRLWRGDGALLGCIEEACGGVKGGDGGPPAGERAELAERCLRREMRRACRRARGLVAPLFARCKELFPGRMQEEWVKIGAEDVAGLRGDEELERLVEAWLSAAASLVFGYVAGVASPLLARALSLGEEGGGA